MNNDITLSHEALTSSVTNLFASISRIQWIVETCLVTNSQDFLQESITNRLSEVLISKNVAWIQLIDHIFN